ncbi:MAG: hypothetical protein KDD62_15315, partial [Bdellovibrionales bacterium]|nr:hypothetical protein [Bdellovibrionales bacterium]
MANLPQQKTEQQGPQMFAGVRSFLPGSRPQPAGKLDRDVFQQDFNRRIQNGNFSAAEKILLYYPDMKLPADIAQEVIQSLFTREKRHHINDYYKIDAPAVETWFQDKCMSLLASVEHREDSAKLVSQYLEGNTSFSLLTHTMFGYDSERTLAYVKSVQAAHGEEIKVRAEALRAEAEEESPTTPAAQDPGRRNRTYISLTAEEQHCLDYCALPQEVRDITARPKATDEMLLRMYQSAAGKCHRCQEFFGLLESYGAKCFEEQSEVLQEVFREIGNDTLFGFYGESAEDFHVDRSVATEMFLQLVQATGVSPQLSDDVKLQGFAKYARCFYENFKMERSTFLEGILSSTTYSDDELLALGALQLIDQRGGLEVLLKNDTWRKGFNQEIATQAFCAHIAGENTSFRGLELAYQIESLLGEPIKLDRGAIEAYFQRV